MRWGCVEDLRSARPHETQEGGAEWAIWPRGLAANQLGPAAAVGLFCLHLSQLHSINTIGFGRGACAVAWNRWLAATFFCLWCGSTCEPVDALSWPPAGTPRAAPWGGRPRVVKRYWSAPGLEKGLDLAPRKERKIEGQKRVAVSSRSVCLCLCCLLMTKKGAPLESSGCHGVRGSAAHHIKEPKAGTHSP